MDWGRDRASVGIIRVLVLLVAVGFVLWLFAIVGPATIEPLHDYAANDSAINNSTERSTNVDRYQSMTLEYAPLLLLVGITAMVIIYAVFRERFTGPRRRP